MEDIIIEYYARDDDALADFRTSSDADITEMRARGLIGETAIIVTVAGLALKSLNHLLEFIIRLRKIDRVSVRYKGKHIEIKDASRSDIEVMLHDFFNRE